MEKYIALYFLYGAILSVVMYMTSKTKLPIKREIAAHLIIFLFWPAVVINLVRIYVKRSFEEDEL